MAGLGRFAKGKKQDDTTCCSKQQTVSSSSSGEQRSIEEAKEGEYANNDNNGPSSSSYMHLQEHSNASHDMFQSSTAQAQTLSDHQSAHAAPDFERFSMGFNGDEYNVMGNSMEFDSMVIEGYDSDMVGGYPVGEVTDFDLSEDSARFNLEDSKDARAAHDDGGSSNKPAAAGAIARFQRRKDLKRSDISSSCVSKGDGQTHHYYTTPKEENEVPKSHVSSLPRQCSDDSTSLPREDSSSALSFNRNNGQEVENESHVHVSNLDSSPSPLEASTKNLSSNCTDEQGNITESSDQCPTLDTNTLPNDSFDTHIVQNKNHGPNLQNRPVEKSTNSIDRINLSNKENSSTNHAAHHIVHMGSAANCLIVEDPTKSTIASDASNNVGTLNCERGIIEELKDIGHRSNHHKSERVSESQKPESMSICSNDANKVEHLATKDTIQDNQLLHQETNIPEETRPNSNNAMMAPMMTFYHKNHTMPKDIERAIVQDTNTHNDLQRRDNRSSTPRDSCLNPVKNKPTNPNHVKLSSQQKIQLHGTIQVTKAQTVPCAKEHHSAMLPVTPSPPPPPPPTRRRVPEDDSVHNNTFHSSHHGQGHDHMYSPYNQVHGRQTQPKEHLKHNNVSTSNSNIPRFIQNHKGEGRNKVEASFSAIVPPKSSTHPPNSRPQEQNFDDLLAAFTEDLVAAGDIWDRCDSQMVDLNVKLCISQNIALRLHADFDDILEEVESILESCDSEKKEADSGLTP